MIFLLQKRWIKNSQTNETVNNSRLKSTKTFIFFRLVGKYFISSYICSHEQVYDVTLHVRFTS